VSSAICFMCDDLSPCVTEQDRIAEDGHPPPEQLVAEKEALKGEDILVVLGALHAQLKSLWAFKVRWEMLRKVSIISGCFSRLVCCLYGAPGTGWGIT
jgi:hypothetical protein